MFGLEKTVMIQNVRKNILGCDLELETGRLAKQANGAVTLRYGDTVLLSTAVCSPEPCTHLGFFPMTVEYREKTAAAGKFPGGYLKREGRPSEKEILTCRIIDRPIRPLIDKNFMNEVQLITTVVSSDCVTDPDVFAITATSAAMSISDIPFDGPVGAVRVGRLNSAYVINPTSEQLKESDMDLVLAGTADAVTMIEGWAQEVSEADVLGAVKAGHEVIKELVAMQVELREKAGLEKIVPEAPADTSELKAKIKEIVDAGLKEAITTKGKKNADKAVKALRQKALETLAEIVDGEGNPVYEEGTIKDVFDSLRKEKVRSLILEENLRGDGRTTTQIRPIDCEIGFLPRTHGSAVFTRGETQSLASITLGSVADAQKYETLEGEAAKTFMVHYNFPPFSVGEVKPLRGVGRREIGHGILAERSLLQVIPDSCPYTIKLVSDILESNGSSSMATVCAGTLSLMDAGIKIKAPVAGIAMGLIKEGDKVAVLSDILGSEDACGDMDFKVTGTEKGITGFQLDLKIKGLSYEIMEQALAQAKEGRMHILSVMSKTIAAPNEKLSVHAPKVATLKINVDKIGMVIGPGGKNIKKIIQDTGADVNIDDDGTVTFSSNSQEAIDAAYETVALMTAEVEVGKIYMGTVKNVVPFGCFVEVLPGKEGLVHISRLDVARVEKVEDVVSVGDKFEVKVTEIDDRGRINLSRKAVLLAQQEKANDTEKEEGQE